jgi:cell wall-associated NlpC family hydrolase
VLDARPVGGRCVKETRATVQSHPVKRVVSGVLAATAAIAVLSFVQSPATAAPAPQTPPSSNTSAALDKYRQLAAEAEKLNEDYLAAQTDLAAKQSELDKAGKDLETAKAAGAKAAGDEATYRVDVDKFASATFTNGVQMNKLSALLTGTSAEDFLARSSALDVLATDQNRVLTNYTGAVNQAAEAAKAAADAQTRAQTAKDAAAKLVADVAANLKTLNDQKNAVAAQAGRLSAADKALQHDVGAAAPNVAAPGPKAAIAIAAAKSKLGHDYVYGATGPNTFDCSGLTSWAYGQAGITIPRNSSAQSVFGTAVSKSALLPGDLVFFGSPVHHVGMYLGDGKMIQAPQTGDVVKISSLQSDYVGARRVA